MAPSPYRSDNAAPSEAVPTSVVADSRPEHIVVDIAVADRKTEHMVADIVAVDTADIAVVDIEYTGPKAHNLAERPELPRADCHNLHRNAYQEHSVCHNLCKR